jgi:ABC-2 type transport system ATP-binding protein
VISTLVADGTTVLLTTQYLEEADQLANQIAVVDLGRIIAKGTSDELKAQVGGERIELTIAPGGDLEAAALVLSPYGTGDLQINTEHRHLTIPVTQGAQILTTILRDLDAAQIPLDDLALRRPTLDDVFLSLTGRAVNTADQPEATPAARPMVRSER